MTDHLDPADNTSPSPPLLSEPASPDYDSHCQWSNDDPLQRGKLEADALSHPTFQVSSLILTEDYMMIDPDLKCELCGAKYHGSFACPRCTSCGTLGHVYSLCPSFPLTYCTLPITLPPTLNENQVWGSYREPSHIGLAHVSEVYPDPTPTFDAPSGSRPETSEDAVTKFLYRMMDRLDGLEIAQARNDECLSEILQTRTLSPLPEVGEVGGGETVVSIPNTYLERSGHENTTHYELLSSENPCDIDPTPEDQWKQYIASRLLQFPDRVITRENCYIEMFMSHGFEELRDSVLSLIGQPIECDARPLVDGDYSHGNDLIASHVEFDTHEDDIVPELSESLANDPLPDDDSDLISEFEEFMAM